MPRSFVHNTCGRAWREKENGEWFNTTFGWIKQLHCPFRDKEADAAKARVMECTSMDEVVPAFIKEAHACLDYMDHDMAEFMKYKDHPVMQETLRRKLGR